MSFETPFLEVLHAAGSATRVLTVGGTEAGLPEGLEDGLADIVVLSPSHAECSQQGWLSNAMDRAVGALAPDGLLYVLVPRPWRSAVTRRLQASGLETGAPFVQLSSGAGGCLVPLRAGPLEAAMRSGTVSRRWSYVARLLADMPNSQWLMASLLPAAGFLAHRPGHEPLSWLKDILPGSEPADALLATSWRGPQGGAVALVFGKQGDRPLAVAKRSAENRRRVRPDEGELLDMLGREARSAGMKVPRVLGRLPGWLVQGWLPGVPMHRLLAANSIDPGEAIKGVAEWLARWNGRTMMRMALTPAACEREILAPARRVCAELHNGRAYLGRLEQAAAGLLWQDVTYVAAHNDLTMANLLQARDGQLAVVDWEMARFGGLPLADFWYSACDAVAAADGYTDRVEAFSECFGRHGRYRCLVREQEERLHDARFGPPAWIDLCFHACWLNHAANEQATSQPGDDRPFLGIAQLIADGGRQFAAAGETASWGSMR